MSRRSIPSLLVLLYLGCGSAGSQVTLSTANPEDSAGSSVSHQGLDVSSFQGQVDWEKVAASGKTFVYIKATEGIDLADSTFDANWQGASEAGLVRGAYHFYQPEDDPKTQAEFFISKVQLEAGDLAPALDVEINKGKTVAELQADVKVWLDAVSEHYGVQPIVYTNVNFGNEFFASGFENYPLWIAHYGDSDPGSVGSWSQWDFWQYSQSGRVDGIEVDVDSDRFQSSENRWQSLLVPGAETATDP